MPIEKICLEFVGFFGKKEFDLIPSKQGIYGVYSGTLLPDKTTMDRQLFYIGQSNDLRTRISSHDLDQWADEKRKKFHEIFFNYAFVSSSELCKRAEAAMIHEHQTTANDKYKNSFPFPDTKIVTSGDNDCMNRDFIVRHKPS